MHRPLLAFASALIALFSILAAPARADDMETCKKSDGDDALAACTRLISSKTLRGGELAQAYVSRGLIYIRFKADWDRAIADYDEALKLNPKFAGAYAGRAAANLRKGNIDRALPDLNEGLRLDPKSPGIHNVFGYYYNKKGDHERALTEVNEALRLYPQYLYAFSNRGEIYEKKGEYTKALADFRMALSLDPDKKQIGGREAAEGIARIEQKLAAVAGPDWTTCSRAPDREDGIPACTRLISAKKLPNHAGIHAVRGIYHIAKGEYDSGVVEFNTAIRLSPQYLYAYRHRAEAYEGKGDLTTVLADYRVALSFDPDKKQVGGGKPPRASHASSRSLPPTPAAPRSRLRPRRFLPLRSSRLHPRSAAASRSSSATAGINTRRSCPIRRMTPPTSRWR
jgi:tetratricopeptide (TPR) repeat protein